MKKLVSLIALSVVASNVLVACGGSKAPMLQPQLQQPEQYNSESFMGVYKEIDKAKLSTFMSMDGNTDKALTPAEYVVNTQDEAKAFYALDDNKDGQVSLKEWMPGFFNKIGLTLRLNKTADSLFKQIDLNRDNYIDKNELNSGLISKEFAGKFENYDKEKKGWLWNKGTLGKLSKSEFENMFANIAITAHGKGAPTAPADGGGATPPADQPAPPAEKK